MSVCSAKGGDSRSGAGSPEHLHAPPWLLQHPVVDGPAPPARRPLLPAPPEGRRVVEPAVEIAPRLEALVNGLHELAPQNVPAPAPLVKDGRVVEEGLDEIELLAEEPAEVVHRL